jgi:hypothetical protein
MCWDDDLGPLRRRVILAGALVSCCVPLASAGGDAKESGLRARPALDRMNGKDPDTASRQNGWVQANRSEPPDRDWRLAAKRTWAFLSVTRQLVTWESVDLRVVSITQDARTLFAVRANARAAGNEERRSGSRERGSGSQRISGVACDACSSFTAQCDYSAGMASEAGIE